MNATFNTTYAGLNINHRKEQKFAESYTAVVIDGDRITEPVTLRIYRTDNRCYTCLWINGSETGWRAGSGWAGGYGYHRASAAAAEAFRAAGVVLEGDRLAGCGDSAIRDAVQVTAQALHPGALVHVVHTHA